MFTQKCYSSYLFFQYLFTKYLMINNQNADKRVINKFIKILTLRLLYINSIIYSGHSNFVKKNYSKFIIISLYCV